MAGLSEQGQGFGQGGLTLVFFMELSPLYLLAVRLAWSGRANVIFLGGY